MKKPGYLFSAVFFLLSLYGCLQEDPMKKPYTGFSPVDIDDGWDISSLAAENIDSLALDKVYRDIYADDDTWMMKSLLVFRNGKLVAENYLKDDADRTEIAAIWSCTKQVTGIITGIAIQQGYIDDVKDPIGNYLTDQIARHPDKSGITLENLLTMKSGIAFDNASASDIFRLHKTDNSIDYVLGLDLIRDPGTFHLYNDGDPQLVSGIIQETTGKTLEEYGKEVLLDPIGLTNYRWEEYTDGVTMGAFGILTSPREMAKIAQCVLDSGRWGDQQIIPPDWWNEMLNPRELTEEDVYFGYYWWIVLSKEYFVMRGHGGQFAFAHPPKNLVVVITSFEQVDDDVNLPFQYIIDIVDRVVATAH